MIEHDPHAKSRIFTLGTAGLLSSLLLISPLTTTVSLILYGALQAAAAPSPDFDGNGAVDFADFFLFADAFGLGQVKRGMRQNTIWILTRRLGFPIFSSLQITLEKMSIPNQYCTKTTSR